MLSSVSIQEQQQQHTTSITTRKVFKSIILQVESEMNYTVIV
jgi:hypothetical protein